MSKLQEGDSLLPVDEKGNILTNDVDYVDTWKAMEECVELGLTKSIGLSNFNSAQIQRVLDVATIRPVVNQVNTTVNRYIIDTYDHHYSYTILL